MHIEPGFVTPVKVIMANAGAVGVVAWGMKHQLSETIKAPWTPIKTLLAAGFFSLFMQSFNMPVGPSELHFVGAMAMYLTLGFTPTLIGFALGLLFQGLAFNPGDLYHLGINSLSLMLPLISVHYLSGRKLFDKSLKQRVNWPRILKLDAMYYTGVTGMVGFWLLIGQVETPFQAWGAFALSYLAVVAIEPVVTWIAVQGLKAFQDRDLVARLSTIRSLTVS